MIRIPQSSSGFLLLECLPSLIAAFLCLGLSPMRLLGEEPTSTDPKRQELHLYMKGRYVYQKHCVECHGSTGRGNGPWAAELEVKPRNFRSGLFKFRTTAYGTQPVDADLRRTIRSGISGTAMPVFSQLHDEEIDALIVYLKNLSKAWKDPALAAKPVPQPSVPGWFSSSEDRARRATTGSARFADPFSSIGA